MMQYVELKTTELASNFTELGNTSTSKRAVSGVMFANNVLDRKQRNEKIANIIKHHMSLSLYMHLMNGENK